MGSCHGAPVSSPLSPIHEGTWEERPCLLLTFPGTNPSPKLTKESYIIYRSLCHAALPTSCLLDLAVLPSPSPCCLCWCDVPLLTQIPGRLGMALCSTTALHEPPRTAGSVSAPRALLGLAEPHKNLLPALAAQFPSLLPLSSARCGTELLTPLSVLSVSLQPLLGKACL